MAELKIEYLDPATLTPYENNTRKHAPSDIEAIKKSIEQDGFNDPIGIWGKQNLIVEGHGRQIAAMEMGLKAVPCIRLDHMTDTQRKEYAIRHNRTAELSAWDFDALQEDLAALAIVGQDLEELKFLNGDFEDVNVDDFFNDDQQPAKKKKVLGVKVICKSEEEVQEVKNLLTEEGYSPEDL